MKPSMYGFAIGMGSTSMASRRTYGVNPRRINDVLKERTHIDSKQVVVSKRDRRQSSPPVISATPGRWEKDSIRYIF
jgi:hypothetical protein